MPRHVVFLDTSCIVALLNRRDPYHERAKEWDERLLAENAELVTHWGVVMEIADGFARLGRRAKGISLLDQLLNEQGYRVITLDDSLLRGGVELYKERQDKEWGLTDCVSFVLMTQEGIQDALTADIHFQQAGFNALLLENE